MRNVRRVGVLGGNRIPFARSNGRYAKASNSDMLGAALDGLVARFGLAGERIGEVAAGAVLKHSRDFNLTREVVLGSTLDGRTPAVDLQQACGTGLQSVIYLANKVALGQIDSGIGGGVDTTSDAPLALNESFRKALLELSQARTLGGRMQAALKLRPLQPFQPEIPRNAEPRTGMSMGEHAALTTLKWGITREAQDELALDSHRNLAAAYDEGFLDDLLTPYLGLSRDQNLRGDSTLDKLARLKPVFGARGDNPTMLLGSDQADLPDSDRRRIERPGPTMTAGNSTPLTDGAALVLLGTDEWAADHHLPVQAYFVDAQTAAVDFTPRNPDPEGLLTAPVYAVPELLARNGLTLQDFDFYEIHEAFASQVLATLAAWESEEFCREKLGLEKALGPIDRTKLNVRGGSLAAGHPFAATGGRIVATLAKLLATRGSGRGLISICAAGGQGVVAILER
ncbi:acetyl-CoA C-acetyltransferase [Hamadaea flava]|uniref:Acetyl-CoA C-acyltransferase n=1 Tax=Hamadaea flava TaxID=1742688 RepID=A0ABV8LFJ4_9ACTN|nr:acetyl-CoA C-acyltransferase [Hamadaea flava]MCP2325981.1 acetyl-CoA C-acetyltransferase [Hamadaea flava]